MQAGSLILLAALLGLVEGPAQVACVVAIALTLVRVLHRHNTPARRARRRRPQESRDVRGPVRSAAAHAALRARAALRLASAGLGWEHIGLLTWLGAGGLALAISGIRPSSQDWSRPLMCLALFVGSHGFACATPRTLRAIAWAFGAAIALNAAYGCVQVLVRGELPLEALLARNPIDRQRVVPGTAHVLAASGLFYNRLKLAHIGVIGLAVLASAAVWPLAPRAHERRWWSLGRRLAAMLGVVVLIGAITLTYSRAAPLAVAVASIVVGFVVRGRKRTGLTQLRRYVVGPSLILGLLVGLLFAVSLLRSQSKSVEFGIARVTRIEQHFDVRVELMRTGLEVFAERPILGWGHGAYRSVPTQHGPVGIEHPHNFLLQILAETGMVGALGFAAALFVPLSALTRRVRRHRRRRGHARDTLDRLALVTILTYLGIGVLHFPLHHAPVAILFWLAVGVAFGARRAERKRTEEASA